MIKHLKRWQTPTDAVNDNNIISPFYGYIKNSQSPVYMKENYTPGTKLKTKISGGKYILETYSEFKLGINKLGIDKL